MLIPVRPDSCYHREVEGATDNREGRQRENFPGQVMSELAPEGAGWSYQGLEKTSSKATGQGQRHEAGDLPEA